ncbi:hypothetical protein [Haliangium ochraceum]|nr:hypothetical protein [Haliangium ochraceum]
MRSSACLRLWIPALALALLVLIPGCKRAAPIVGIGGFELDKTQLGSLSGRCFQPGEGALMRCPGIAAVSLGGQNAEIELYFPDDSVESTLREIMLVVSNCNVEALDAYLRETLGKPSGTADKRSFWASEHSYVSAALPGEMRECEVNFVSLQDAERIAELGGTPGVEK